ncbi:MAG: carboxypeptidase-like regulatory domain-containing protein, partial [Chloroflexota bacterium]
MKKLLSLLFLVVFATGISRAAVSNMIFSESIGTYTEITGGTVLLTGTFDGGVNTSPLGFTFNANGVDFTSMKVCADGYVFFHPTSTSSLGYSPISSTTVANMVISAMGRDLQGLATGEVRVETIGTAPNRVAVIQWKNVKRYGTNYSDESLNFQIRIYETLNKVEMVYGPCTGGAYASAIHPQVGLRGAANTDFSNRTSTTSWLGTAAGAVNNATVTLSNLVAPSTGLTYTYTVPAPSAAIYSSPVNNVTGAPISVTLNWAAGTTGGTPTGYNVYFGTDNPPTNIANGVNVGTALTYDPNPDLAYATTYYWQVVPYNGTGSATNNPIWSFTTSLGIGTLEGFVTNGFGIPLGGVTLTLSNSNSTFTTTSNANGSYQFANVLAANYTLSGN